MDTTSPLKAFRDKHNPPLTQDRLADLLGVTRTTVARWETGTRKIDRDLIAEVSKKTGIPPVDLRPDLAALMQGEAAE